MIVTIDGPAGSGKSSTARAVADQLGFRHLESGALYRGITFAAQRAGIPPDQWDDLDLAALERLAVRAIPAEQGFSIVAGNDDITTVLRSPDVHNHVARMAQVPAVRAWLLQRLRSAAHDVDLVADGRDMGTVVFPDADVKVFLTASLETRARRRVIQEADPDDPHAIARELDHLSERDRTDTQRAVAPLRPAHDAVHLDTTDLDFDAQVQAIVTLVRARLSGPAD
jgi:cytidylate kinase